MSAFNIVQSQWDQDKDQLIAIRKQVFIIEQQVPPELELDERDTSAIHFLAYGKYKQAIGTARLLTATNNTAQIGRMAVLKAYRGKGCGKALLSACIQYAKEQSFNEVFLHAQNHAIPFYQKTGFNIRGDEFMDAGIPHNEMFLHLKA